MLNKEQAIQRVSQIDLSDVARRVQKINGFDDERLAKAMRMYRKFLALMLMYPDVPMISPPSQDTDEVWHNHILHTKKYANDCNTLFGKFRHHTPMEATDHNLQEAERMIRKLWKENGFHRGEL